MATAAPNLIAEIHVAGTPVPWSAPRTFLGGKPGGKRHHVHAKDERLIAWQDAVRTVSLATVAFVVDHPYMGPVMVEMTFIRKTAKSRLWGRQRWTPTATGKGNGDLTNLAKATEDAICTRRQYKGKGADRVLVSCWPGLIENDAQVCDLVLSKRFGPHDGVTIRVYAIEEDAP